MAHNLPFAGTVTALLNVTFIFPVVHEIELLAESKLPLVSYSAPSRLSLPQLAPTSTVIIPNLVPAARPVNKLPKGLSELGCVSLSKTPVCPLSTIKGLGIAAVVAAAVLDRGLVPTLLIAETRYVYNVLEANPVSEYVVDVEP